MITRRRRSVAENENDKTEIKVFKSNIYPRFLGLYKLGPGSGGNVIRKESQHWDLSVSVDVSGRSDVI